MIAAAAPGKVVLWGEYAVLAGAPALVMAVDRYARCTLRPGGAGWRFSALGHPVAQSRCASAALLAPEPPPADAAWHLVWHALAVLAPGSLPAGAAMALDTGGFQHQGRKLGLGSSAALAVAVYAACARLLGQTPHHRGAEEAHRSFQGGAGSGIDVAAAWFGGTLRFCRTPGASAADHWPLPDDVHLTFVYSGAPASTARHLERLRRWRERGGAELDALGAASEAVFRAPELTGALAEYVDALAALDQAAELGIFSPAHRRLRRLAFDAGVVYKPCGAGGGDIGAGFTRDAAAAQRFARLATENGFLPLALETAPHGIEVTG